MTHPLHRSHTFQRYADASRASRTGPGELSLAIAEALPEATEQDALILLDQRGKPRGRQGHNRHPADSALRSRYGARFARVKLGLEHVSLDGLRDAYAPGRPIVVVAKHLCGAASDFALRAVIAACAGPHPPVAVVLGTCCHQLCNWRAYPNRAYLEALGISARQFGLLCRLSSRGVNGGDPGSERAAVGRRAKDVLDEGRAAFLREHGFEARLCTYVDASVTPENVLLVATRRTTCD